MRLVPVHMAGKGVAKAHIQGFCVRGATLPLLLVSSNKHGVLISTLISFVGPSIPVHYRISLATGIYMFI